MKIFLVVLFAVLFLLFVPIKLKFKVDFDFLSNKGYLSLYFFSLKLLVSKLFLLPTKLVIITHGKRDYLPFFDPPEKKKFKDIFFEKVVSNVDVANLRLFSNFGLFGDGVLSSMGAGALNIAGGLACTYFMQKRNLENATVQNFMDMTSNKFIVAVTSSINVSFFLIIFCALQTLVYMIKNRGKL